jgi:hypothetical protein
MDEQKLKSIPWFASLGKPDLRQVAEALQLAIEYDPQPPFDAGSPVKADASTLRLAMRILLGDRPVASPTRFVRQAVGARVDRGRRALAGRRSS